MAIVRFINSTGCFPYHHTFAIFYSYQKELIKPIQRELASAPLMGMLTEKKGVLDFGYNDSVFPRLKLSNFHKLNNQISSLVALIWDALRFAEQ